MDKKIIPKMILRMILRRILKMIREMIQKIIRNWTRNWVGRKKWNLVVHPDFLYKNPRNLPSRQKRRFRRSFGHPG